MNSPLSFPWLPPRLTNLLSPETLTYISSSRLDNPSDHLTSQFLSVLSSFNLTQHVDCMTHNKSHILDLVITSSDYSLAPSLTTTLCTPSDHLPIFTKLSDVPTPLPPPTCHLFHRFHSIDIDLFLSGLQSSSLITSPLASLGSFSPPIMPSSPHYCINMLLSSLSSLNAPPNPTLGSLLLSVPSDPQFVVLKTSINALTLLFHFHPSSLSATAITNSSSHPKRSITLTLSLLRLIIFAVSGKLSVSYSIGNRHLPSTFLCLTFVSCRQFYFILYGQDS